ncbi:chemotaxis response regulator protein-glutamate methylesterase [Nocardioides marmoriginsengisoli]|uniref:Protein-glutamate methylesterase/protein-glutamine glutaminase n=1 Tax=Nocardioides marmoriginsengisoli TaxID=661483 RepID=A0A3N0CGW0_9ACTN|nr:chemotaxis response regulator protein-glutamate methylesterase [Nocardioides marmoriginsengisoli]RNL62668.1 chemotaxis response regulator protein-glutamate methylesterase [Nocardioides marmoriginsengisoli]
MIRVLVVDDSALVRRLVTTSLSLDPEIEVVGIAVHGREAVDRVEELRPDAVTLDIEMPVLDGLGALAAIRRRHPRLPVIMFSTLTEKGATKTLEALSLGASDFVTKPSNTTSMAESMASVREQLIPKVKALVGARRVVGPGRSEGPARTPPPVRVAAPSTTRPEVLVIGCSTGGPDALSRVLEELPGTLRVPVLVVQHMPPLFTTMLAERLDRVSALSVREAVEGDVPAPGQVLVAPGGLHLRVRRSAGVVRVHLDDGPQENFCRPAVDALFRSAAEAYGGAVAALVLTGMGQDGLIGCQLLAEQGAWIAAQDEASSVVWGMPGAVASAGLAHEVLPLEDVAGKLAAALA